jgi:hypothetical protein
MHALTAQYAILIALQHERPLPLMLTRREPIMSHVRKDEKTREIGSMSPQILPLKYLQAYKPTN